MALDVQFGTGKHLFSTIGGMLALKLSSAIVEIKSHGGEGDDECDGCLQKNDTKN